VETSDASLEANFTAVFFHDNLFALIGLIGVVKFRDLADDPEGLSVELLFQINRKQVRHLVLVAHDDE